MLHAVVSDIHGNIDALESVLEDVARRNVSSVACLGDFVGYGSHPNECIERLRPLIEIAVAGNHDLAACGRLKLGYFNPDAAVAARWTEQQLSEENRAYLHDLPYSVLWRGLRLVHSSPAQPDEWHYVLSPADAEEEMKAYDEAVCLIGHSHYPGAFEWTPRRIEYTRQPEIRMVADHRYLVNVASVGQPRDGDPRAGYLLYDDKKNTLIHVRIDYDVERAVERILGAGLPRFLAERLRWGD
jgi:diadenosine tetraphosphatase ApaH/serine/threonine PP2A family protein phosphatase